MDYANWNTERALLKNEIYKELRDQKDRESKVVDSGQINLDPSFLEKDIPSEYGPYFFRVPFASPPSMAFAQIRAAQAFPVWTILDISRWEASTGAIVGFYLGILALKTPPATVTAHRITWIAQGQASVYHQSGASDAWTESYTPDYNSTLNINQQ
jgi:hypothetical protein